VLNRLTFWLWHRTIANRLRNNPLGARIWEIRVRLVYIPLFEKGGLQDVYSEHARYTAYLTSLSIDLLGDGDKPRGEVC